MMSILPPLCRRFAVGSAGSTLGVLSIALVLIAGALGSVLADTRKPARARPEAEVEPAAPAAVVRDHAARQPALPVDAADAGADDDEEADPSTVSEALLKRRIQRAQDNSELDEEERQEVVDQYKRALEHLSEEAEAAEKTESLTVRAEKAPARLNEAKSQLESSRPDPASVVKPSASLNELRTELSQAEADLDESIRRRDELQAEVDHRPTRRMEDAARETELEELLEEIEDQLERKPDQDASKELAEAQTLVLRARRQAAAAELQQVRQEILTDDLTTDLLLVERDLAVIQAEYAQKLADAWMLAVNSGRRGEIELQAREASRQAAQAAPELKSIAERTVELTAQRQTLVERIERVQQQVESADTQTTELTEEFDKVAERARRAGFTETVAIVLRRRRDNLPDVARLRECAREREHETAQLSLQLAELEDDRRTLADLGSAVSRRKRELAAQSHAEGGTIDEAALR
ncbi:MAG: hypothetical protein EHM42_08620, partial [Planctomycetaceae bacterium]